MLLLGMWPNLEPERVFAQWAPWAPRMSSLWASRVYKGSSLRRGWRAERLAHGSARAARSGWQTWLLEKFHRSQSKTTGIVKSAAHASNNHLENALSEYVLCPTPIAEPISGDRGPTRAFFLILEANAARAVWELPLLSLLFSRFAYVL